MDLNPFHLIHHDTPAVQENTMATAPVVPAVAPKTALQKIAQGFKDVFAFLTSTRGQALVATGEAVATTIYPGAGGLISIGNTWLTEIIKAETLAAAAGQQEGTGTQKAAMVLQAVTPNVLEFAKANGLPVPTADKLAAANKALVDFTNAFTA